MNSETEKVLEKVQKLMRLAEDAGASEQEVETAMRQAQKLLLKHNLTMETALGYSGSRDRYTEKVIEDAILFRNRPWTRTIFSSVAKLYYCRYMVFMGDIRTKTRHVFIGRESNSRTASMMAGYVVSAILASARSERRRTGGSSEFESSYCLGAAQRVARRIYDMLQSADVATGTGLMVIDKTSQENQSYIEKKYSNSKVMTAKSTRVSNEEGYRNGDEYGKKIGLNDQIESGGTSQCLTQE